MTGSSLSFAAEMNFTRWEQDGEGDPLIGCMNSSHVAYSSIAITSAERYGTVARYVCVSQP
jgi:hypothetical protein